MMYLAAARRIVCVLFLLFGAFGADRIPAGEARVPDASSIETQAILGYQSIHVSAVSFIEASSEYSLPTIISEPPPTPATSEQLSAVENVTPVQTPIEGNGSTVVALAEKYSPDKISEPNTPIAPQRGSSHWSAPARFFTINQVLAQNQQVAGTSSAIHLASIDPKVASDASSIQSSATPGDEPFGLFTFRAPDGLLWTKWRKVEDDIQSEAPTLSRCLTEFSHCTPAAAQFAEIIKQAEKVDGRAKFELVNQRVNAAIHYMTDMEQWGVADRWSAPLDMDAKGSFDTGFGDCEDYAIAKYVALREAGVSAQDLRLLLVRDNAVHLDHAVLAARQDGHWLVLDNRWSKLIEDKELHQFAPFFTLNEDGVKLFAAPYAARGDALIHTENLANQDIAAGNTSTSPSYASGGIISLPLLM